MRRYLSIGRETFVSPAYFAVALALLPGFTISSVAAEPSFAAPPGLNWGMRARSVLVGDVNGDGKVDAIAGGTALDGASGRISVALSNGDGTFQPPVVTQINTEQFILLSVGDFNSDGRADVLFGGYTNPVQRFFVYLGDGAGRFVQCFEVPTLAERSVSAAGDFNGDGKLDVVNTYANLLNVFPGNGDGTFLPPIQTEVPSHGSLPALATGDLNHDGKLDVLMEYFDGLYTLQCLLGNGDGSFKSNSTGLPNNLKQSGFELVLTDMDHDGNLDALDGFFDQFTADLRIFKGNGDGTFRLPVTYTLTQTNAFEIVPVDLDGNGCPDLFLPSRNGGPLVLLRNRAVQGLGEPEILVGGSALDVAAADFDSDGATDLVTATGWDYGADGVGAYLAQRTRNRLVQPQVTPAGTSHEMNAVFVDFNEDGRMDTVTAAGAFLIGLGAGRFEAPVSLGAAGTFVVDGDWNGDGHRDAVFLAGNSAQMILGAGDGTFAAPVTITGTSSMPGAAVADFNSDGYDDVIAINFGTSTVGVAHGSPGGLSSFSNVTLTSAPNPILGVIAAGDVNSDGRPDVVVVTDDGLLVALNNGSGGLSASSMLETDQLTYALKIGDFNRDAIPDILASAWDFDYDKASTELRPGRGDGSFAPPIPIDVISQPRDFAYTDVDGDTIPDLVGCGVNGDIGIASGKPDGSYQPPIVYMAGSGCASVYAGPLSKLKPVSIAAFAYYLNTAFEQGNNYSVSVLLPSADTVRQQ